MLNTAEVKDYGIFSDSVLYFQLRHSGCIFVAISDL